MEILDKNGKLIALAVYYNEIEDGRNFLTSPNKEIQVATFSFDSETIIDRHIHNFQKRNITTTPEMLVVLEGELEISIYDEELNFLSGIILKSRDSIALFCGGHKIIAKKNSKFIESKQGPYNHLEDKQRF